MNIDYIRTLFGYHYWAHDKVWDCIMHLNDAQFTQEQDYSIGSIRNHVVHLMSVDNRWLARVLNTPLPDRLVYTDFPTREAARTRWSTIKTQVLDSVDSLNDDYLNQIITFDLPHRGGIKHNYIWEILAHVVNHGTDHRAQILTILHKMGAPTVEHDMAFYLWENKGK